jgi:hypothetical protein
MVKQDSFRLLGFGNDLDTLHSCKIYPGLGIGGESLEKATGEG